MPLPSSDLPPWLRHSGAAPRGSNNRAAVTAAFAVLLFAAGAGSGVSFFGGVFVCLLAAASLR